MSVLEFGYVSLNKKGEELCGDKVETAVQGEYTTLVLADGMGSGVKANILATLTSKILCTMVSAGIELNECIDTIIDSLPVCKQRNLAYSTFSVVHLKQNGEGYLAEFDNPPALLIRDGKSVDLNREMRVYQDKKINVARLCLQPQDMLVLFSDGVVHAGVGQTLNFGWDKKEITEFAEISYDRTLSARTMASILAGAADRLYAGLPGDDTTILCCKYRPRLYTNMMIGPPSSGASDAEVVAEFMSGNGKKIVCGGTSSQVVARCTGKKLSASFDFPDRDVPPIGYIDGIDLTCEGALTLKKLMTYAREYLSPTSKKLKLYPGKDGASLLANMLLIDATDVNVFVGRNVNLAHEGLGIDNKTKLDLISELGDILKKLNKNVSLKYY